MCALTAVRNSRSGVQVDRPLRLSGTRITSAPLSATSSTLHTDQAVPQYLVPIVPICDHQSPFAHAICGRPLNYGTLAMLVCIISKLCLHHRKFGSHCRRSSALICCRKGMPGRAPSDSSLQPAVTARSCSMCSVAIPVAMPYMMAALKLSPAPVESTTACEADMPTVPRPAVAIGRTNLAVCCFSDGLEIVMQDGMDPIAIALSAEMLQILR